MIFGTDGIRGRVGTYPLDEETITKLSHVLESWLRPEIKVVIGRDTRASCEEIRAWITAHLDGITVLDLGVVPTPVVAYETRAREASLGIMITASHNPAGDNGLKFFDRKGLKLEYGLAESWSNKVIATGRSPSPRPAEPSSIKPDHYARFIHKTFSKSDFEGLRIGFDLAHGAASPLIEKLALELGLDARFTGNTPDGTNINRDVGALYPDALATMVRERNLDVGFAFDGDADRLLVVQDTPLHGDVTLYALYRAYRDEGLEVSAIVGTIMCGMGLQRRLEEEGIELIRTAVGDQNVLHELVGRNLMLGGETSGHLIQTDLFPAGDGFLAALRLARALGRNRDLLRQAHAAVPLYPTYEKAYTVRHKPPLERIADLKRQVMMIRGQLGDTGRLIIRYSGTEPKLRLNVEAPDLAPFQTVIEDLETIIARELQ